MNCSRICTIKTVIAVCYILAFGCLYLYDQPLKPEVTRLINSIPQKIATENNLYFAMVGFSSPAGTDCYQYGVRQFERARAHKDSGKKGELPAEKTDTELKLKGELPSFYKKAGAGMRQFIAKEPARVEALLHDNRELMERYRSLRRYAQYEEPLFLNVWVPYPHVWIYNAKQLEQLRLMRSGSNAELLRFARDDLAFWRRFTSKSRTLIGKLVGIRTIIHHYHFMSEFAAGPTVDEATRKAVITELLQPIPYSELSMAQAFHEEIYSYSIQQDLTQRFYSPPPALRALLSILEQPLFNKRNMTINLVYDYFLPGTQQAELTPKAFAAQHKKSQEPQQNGKKIGEPLFNWLTNPAGELHFGMHPFLSLPYVAKLHRVEWIRRQALLKVQIAHQKISDHAIPDFLARAGKDLSNPFTDQPMYWDQKNRKLYFIYFTGADQAESVDMYLE